MRASRCEPCQPLCDACQPETNSKGRRFHCIEDEWARVTWITRHLVDSMRSLTIALSWQGSHGTGPRSRRARQGRLARITRLAISISGFGWQGSQHATVWHERPSDQFGRNAARGVRRLAAAISIDVALPRPAATVAACLGCRDPKIHDAPSLWRLRRFDHQPFTGCP